MWKSDSLCFISYFPSKQITTIEEAGGIFSRGTWIISSPMSKDLDNLPRLFLQASKMS